MKENKIYIKKNDDRLTVASILVDNGYTVRQGKQRREKSNVYDYFLVVSLDGAPEK